MYNLIIYFIILIYSFHNIMNPKHNPGNSGAKAEEWTLSSILDKKEGVLKIDGNPKIIRSPYGKAVSFNGADDGVFLEKMPLTGLEKFTVEVILRPDSGGSFEQRFLHIGEVTADRFLMELRSVPGGWYLDGFLKIGTGDCTLIDPNRLHPSDTWYHAAFVCDRGNCSTWVNGIKELEGMVNLVPLTTGKTSIGVRQNEISWFRGTIYKIRITPEALTPDRFMKLK